MDIVARIRSIIEMQNLSSRAFAIKCGITPQTLDMQMKGNRAVSLETVYSILSTNADISAEWLIRGDGTMFKQEFQEQEYDRIYKLIDTITTLQDVINEKNKTIALLTEQIQQLKNQLK